MADWTLMAAVIMGTWLIAYAVDWALARRHEAYLERLRVEDNLYRTFGDGGEQW